MSLTSGELAAYQRDGFLLRREFFRAAEVATLRAALSRIISDPSEARVMEQDGISVRSVHGCHKTDVAFRNLAHSAELVVPSMQILSSEVYVYQFKVNAKRALSGDVWEWHQDYTFWREEDGMPADRAVNVLVFLEEIHEFNGPVMLMAGSHRFGVLEGPARADSSTSRDGDPDWMASFTANLKYSVSRERLAALAASCPVTAPKGPAGSVLFFHPSLIHGSAPNMSPSDRPVAIVTYNSVENVPLFPGVRRPAFLVSEHADALLPFTAVDGLALAPVAKAVP
jgi:ectoine hydroxylase